jgi:PAS domain S-box-containing protein
MLLVNRDGVSRTEMDNKTRRVRDNEARLNRGLRTISRCNRELFHARGEPELLQSICRILVETAEVDLAWIGYCEDDAEKTVRPVASAGSGADYLQRVHHSWGPTQAGRGPVGEAIRSGKRCRVKDIRTDPIFCHGRTDALALGYRSCVAFPLAAETPSGGLIELRGALALYARADDSFDESEIDSYAELASYLACTISRLRSHLADDVSHGVRALLIRGERKRVEEALQSSEDRLRLIINTIPTMAWSALPDGSWAFVNQRWSEYTGFSTKDSAGSGWQGAFHPEDIGSHMERWRASLATGESFENEARVRRAADGEYRWFLLHGRPLRDESGRIVRWYGTATDIEERKRAEAKIRRLVDSNIIGIFIWNLDGRIIDANEAYLRLIGYDRGDLIAGRLSWRALTPLEWREADDRRVAQLKATGTSQAYEKEYFRRDGTRVPVLVGAAGFEGRPSEGVGFVLDLTDRKRAERAYTQVQMELAHANRVATMGQLSASIAHEISQPLGAALSYANAASHWLDAQPPNLEEVRRGLGFIVESSVRASEVIDRIRALVKKAPPRKDRLEINEAILQVIALAQNEIASNGILVRTQLVEALPAIQGDRVQLQQVIVNLLINAIEAMSGMSEGSRELLISTAKTDSEGVLVAVRDSGPGFAPENVDRLFESFYTTKPNGLGMGLSICRSIIEAHHGRLWATANTPHGAIFQFTLPPYSSGEKEDR